MFLISHRGNLNGPNIKDENNPDYIMEALSKDFDVEIDVRNYKNKLYLGHDEPMYEVNESFLINKKLWCHAKDVYALEKLRQIDSIYFWHQNDDYTITSNGYFWTYPGITLVENSICVMPEISEYININCKGICSDFINNYKNK